MDVMVVTDDMRCRFVVVGVASRGTTKNIRSSVCLSVFLCFFLSCRLCFCLSVCLSDTLLERAKPSKQTVRQLGLLERAFILFKKVGCTYLFHRSYYGTVYSMMY